MRKLTALLCLLVLCIPAAWGEPVLEDRTVPGPGESFVSYPVVTLEDPEATALLNDTLWQSARIGEYLELLAGLSGGGAGLKVTWVTEPADPGEGLLSVVISAKGKMLEGRPSQRYYAFVFDTVTGEQVPFASLFSDPDAALAAMEEDLTSREETLNEYMENRSLLPVPENYALSDAGIILYYPYDQVSFLSGYAGSVRISYDSVWELLDPDGPVCLFSRVAEDHLPHEGTGEKILQAAREGMLYSQPARVGEPLEDALERFHTGLDSSYYLNGACYETEDPRLEGTLLITDRGEESVTGLMARSISLAGLRTGSTVREEVVQYLGEPSSAREVTPEDEQQRLLTAGQLDCYEAGAFLLEWNYDTQMILRAVILRQRED